MAIPSTFNAACGLALMRQAPGGEWFFVCWVVGASAIALEVLTAGTHRYELWEVVGASQTIVHVTYDGPVSLGVIQMHK
jgi:hypothetical protein